MKISFACPNCQTKYSARHQQAGKEGNCKTCGVKIVVPNPNHDTSTAQGQRGADHTRSGKKKWVVGIASIVIVFIVYLIFRGIGSRIYNISLLSEFSEPDRPSAEVKKPETAPMPEMEKMVRVIKAPSAKIEYSATDKYGITLGTTADDVLAKRGRVIRTIKEGSDAYGLIVSWVYADRTYVMGRREKNRVTAYRVIEIKKERSLDDRPRHIKVDDPHVKTFYKGKNWTVLEESRTGEFKQCALRSSPDYIDKFKNPKYGTTYLEISYPSNDVIFFGENIKLYFKVAKQARLQVDEGKSVVINPETPIAGKSIIDSMVKGNAVKIEIDFSLGEPSIHTFSLLGFTQAYKMLQACAGIPSAQTKC